MSQRDELEEKLRQIEARRYVRKMPAETDRLIEKARNGLQDLRRYNLHIEDHAYRWSYNLFMGSCYVVVSPHVLEGYIDGTLFELALVKGRTEKEQS